MYNNEIKTIVDYYRRICNLRSMAWDELMNVEDTLGNLSIRELYNSLDRRPALASWHAYETAVVLCEQLLDNMREVEES